MVSIANSNFPSHTDKKYRFLILDCSTMTMLIIIFVVVSLGIFFLPTFYLIRSVSTKPSLVIISKLKLK
ncbi:hypothetical protein DERP_010466 [Dermatophagoides pteronyssinus]|uniref:Uncharacterized protein n=1 Tax=Dermatophagoides pteronyssinus TaxID=6956 RepID=A0ABQ8J541_DERPT|nr:hypothetical protein DERP_010466 [Dermatophagoides pteronyssinus]